MKLRGSLTRHFWKHGKRMLALIQQPVIELSDQIGPQELKDQVKHLLRPEFIDSYLKDMWVQSGSVTAMDTIRQVERVSKKGDSELVMEHWTEKYRRYTRQRSNYFAAKVLSIMDTQDRAINNIIDLVLDQATREGWGAAKTGSNLKRELNEGLATMNTYQAERIARTEVNSASNAAGWDVMKEMGVAKSKTWVTMEDEKVRPLHQEYMGRGDQELDYEYAPGLKYPNDPDCEDGGEVINCRCTPFWNIESVGEKT